MDALIRPQGQRLQHGDGGLQHGLADLGVRLGLLVGEELHIVAGAGIEEIHLFGDIRQPLAAGLQQPRDSGYVEIALHRLPDVRLRCLDKGLRCHASQIDGVEMIQLGPVEDGGGLGDTRHVKGLHQLRQSEDLLLRQLAPGRPAQQRHIVEDGLGEIALRLQILIGRITVALGHLVLGVPHHGGAVDIGRHVPAEGVVQKIVLGRGGQILAAPHHMGDAHEMIVDDVGEVVGGQTVPLQQHLIVQRAVLHGDVTEDGVVEGGGPLGGDLLPDHIRLTGLHALEGVLQRQLTAGIGGAVELAAVLLRGAFFAEAVVRAAFFHQKPGILTVGIPALRLDIRSHRAAYIGTLIVGKAALGHGSVNHIGGALHQTALIGVLNAEDERAAVAAGNEPGVQRRAQVAHMHIAGGGGGEPGADAALGDAGFHLIKIRHIHAHRGDLL